MDSAKPATLKTWEPTPYTVKLEARTDIPSLAPELFRQMYKLGEAHGLESPHETVCEVRVVFKNKVSQQDVRRLLKDAEASMWGLDVSCHEGEGDD